METAWLIIGLGLMLASWAYCIYKASWYFRRGAKDHVWIWDDANRAARFIGFVGLCCGVGLAIRDWPDFHFPIYFTIFGSVFLMPYLVYASGRLWGIWRRSRSRSALYE